MNIKNTLQELITIGEELAPLGGTEGLRYASAGDYNKEKQPEYESWRIQSLSAISELGQPAQILLKELSNYDYHYFYKVFAYKIIGALKAALAIAERQSDIDNRFLMSSQNINKSSRNIFVVHGHDKALLNEVARFLEKLDLKPIVLFEQPGKGHTIIEKLEINSNASFTIVLLTPDDVGKDVTTKNKVMPRARQNVIFELGYFIGKLGRSNVIALYDEKIELPSDYHGVEYVRIDSEGAWKLVLAKEIKASGIVVNIDKVL